MKGFFQFITEGKREEAKMNELLDKGIKNLSSEERDLLSRLSRGESLPEEIPELKMHKTGGGYMYDDEGNVITTDEEELKPGKEFTTNKGKIRPVDKIEEILNARVYRNRDNEERFIYAYMTEINDGVETKDWIIYRTDGGKEFGKILDTNIDRLKHYKKTIPDVLWKELDFKFDYCMVLDQDLYEDFMNFIELYKAGGKRGRDVMDRLHRRFCTLL